MAIPTYYLLPPLPPSMEGLAEMALDLRWSWSHTADELWEHIAPELWNITRNPWLILQMVTLNRLEDLAADHDFLRFMNYVVKAHQESARETTWFQQTYSDSRLSIAYFSMEYGLSESLPLYSGGLGILAGDYLKTASDLGVPLIGIGLLYQQGYFRQALDAHGYQIEFYPYNDPYQLPVLPVRNQNDEWLRVMINFPGRQLWLRIWVAKVGRVKIYLLDSNDPMNSPADRGITSELYGGGPELRLQQEIVLGIGGWRTLQALGIESEVCHLNEGHAALAVIERARSFMESSDQPFDIALAATRAGNIFTTHTPVEAGFDRFLPELISRYLGDYADDSGIGLTNLLAMGRQDPANNHEPLNMAYLALRGSGMVNGVSRLHGEVSRRIFQPLFPRWPRFEVPVTYVTNGVHMPSWDSAAADTLWSDACGKGRWTGTMDTIMDDLKVVPDQVLWNFRMAESKQLIQYVRDRLARQLASVGASAQEIDQSRQLLDTDILTIGFARRFASYKRPNLLLHDREHLTRILSHPTRPVQLIIAGKAHPHDEEGKAMIREWSEFILRPEVRSHVVFITDYAMDVAEHLVQGVDLWINTPRRPWEACGTSGMKVLVNGGLNLSVRDGWWAEAYRPKVGWAIGDGQEHGDDPGWDAKEAQQLYQVLEQEIIPCFYNRDDNGVPRDWVARMRVSMAELTPQFSSNRMVREYVDRLYLATAQNYHNRTADGAKESVRLCQWQELIETYWQKLHLRKLNVQSEGGDYIFSITVYLDELDPKAVQVQLYADPSDDKGPEIHVMEVAEAAGTANSYLYHARIPALRPVEHYTPRIIPYFNGVAVPLEARQILWYRS
ncbi:alpha-glucan family phosphorylase [Chloroflexota bacterium]